MARFRIKSTNAEEVYDRKHIQSNKAVQVVQKYHISIKYYARLIWEMISSTFLDKEGNVFCDKEGNPFMGKD